MTIEMRPLRARVDRGLVLLLASVLAWGVLGWNVAAQPADPTVEEPAAEATDRSQELERLATLEGVLESIAGIEGELTELEEDYQAAETEEQRAVVSQQLEERLERIRGLEEDFSVLATGIDPAAFFEQSTETFDWQQELEDIFAPVVLELKAASAYPRELEALRSELALTEKRLPAVDAALVSLERLKTEETVSNGLQERLDELLEFWTRQRDELVTHYASTEQRLAEKEAEKLGLGHATTEIFRTFFRQRFFNLLLAMLVFAGIVALLRWLHRLAHRRLSARGTATGQLFIRLVDIAYYLFTLVAALLGLLVVLYLSADWLLLSLVVLLLVGVLWATRNAIPRFFEQAKLLLNIGAVREGERLVYNGVPWRVASLSFYSELVNPLLRGGSLRLPLRDLIGLRSRQAEEDEPWFPSQLGDWVIASDGTYGEVVEQTPDVVILSTVRGSYKHYPTVDYVEQHPKNLSTNFFSVNHTVGVDYRYRDIVNTEIASKLKAGIREGIEAEPYGEHLVQVIAELQELGSSSLDLITIAKFRGGAASEYFEIGWKLQQLALEVCNANGWEIPFPQRVLHHAEVLEPET